MNIATPTFGQAAVAGAPQRFAPHAKPGQAASAASVCADDRAEARVSAAMAAKVRTGQGERPGCIRNLSPRGAMLSMAKPPQRGEYVEIIVGPQSLIGQVRWASDCRAGIALGEPVDVRSVLAGEIRSITAKAKPVRRTFAAPVAVHAPRDSHIIARQLQFAAVIAFGTIAALMTAYCVNDLLTDVIRQVRMGLPG